MRELISKHRLNEPRRKEPIGIPLSKRVWLGGAFETAGGIYFSIDEKRNMVIPRVEISDSDPTVPSKLHENFGGWLNPRSDNDFTWIISGSEASRIAISMSPFAPSRQRVINLIRELKQNENSWERVTMVREFRKREIGESNKAEDYLGLLEIPEFVAGIIDIRGVVYSSPGMPHSSSQLRVQTANVGLIEALIKKIGGEKNLDSPKGSIFSIGGKQYATKRDQFHWSLGMGKTAQLYRFIKPYLLGEKIKGYTVL